jgi:dephospho-CoA kinase
MNKKKIVLGLTGSFGSGKTTVARMFRALGASVIDADKIYDQLIKPKGPLYKKIISCFGTSLIRPDSALDKKALAGIVFTEDEQLKKLQKITHPVIIREIKQLARKSKRRKQCRVLVIDAPLLIEAGLMPLVDRLIVVKIGQDKQIQRCAKHWKISRRQILQRIKAQIPLVRKKRLADYVIDNSGSLEQTRKQVKEIWNKVKK